MRDCWKLREKGNSDMGIMAWIIVGLFGLFIAWSETEV